MIRFLSISILSVFFAYAAIAQQAAASSTPPRLVVGIVVDQMRYDYIYRFWNKYGNGGFKRLVNQGYFCRNTHYNYAPTYTAPGHASVYTGATPAVHGIIGNNWFVREENKSTYCTDDHSVKTVGSSSTAGEMSPANMWTNSITDELRLTTNLQAKVIGISLKDRGSILPAGHLANAAYWFDSENGAFITSTYYMQALPDWVSKFNAKDKAKEYLSKEWNTLLPIAQYSESLEDDNVYEGLLKGEAKALFPHNLPKIYTEDGYELIRSTPFGNSLVKDFALEAIQTEKLGKGNATDFLAVSFSSTDYIGHKYGPRSIELEDTYLRLDRDLAQLLTFLDTYLGKEKVLVFLTADHAGAEVPAYLESVKVPAGYFASKQHMQQLKGYLYQTYSDSLVTSFINQQVYLNDKVMEEKKLNKEEIQQAIAQYVLKMTGVSSSATALAMQRYEYTQGINSLIQKGYHARRSGDVMVNLLPQWMEYSKTGTTHGSPYTYDTHVPLLWYGWTIKPGSSVSYVAITDIAPTLAFILKTSLPNGTTGKPIEALVK
ncbi:alkaline phosphatase family protein [Rhodocytophaga aerolata]|uniref:Alkaline phosphatase family protein n=1 Tax=Rhodocytophaga aerolata TaxID=455078 RepID=A0ABT8R5S2_9BACT|nr:alkaline phosphatase PafA [Rhodocytophaga aerolata]MDO1446618.1 alkaline phosphatase family protein [Rhodocytophaga aerolata]